MFSQKLWQVHLKTETVNCVTISKLTMIIATLNEVKLIEGFIQRCTNANLKISLYVLIEIKTSTAAVHSWHLKADVPE